MIRKYFPKLRDLPKEELEKASINYLNSSTNGRMEEFQNFYDIATRYLKEGESVEKVRKRLVKERILPYGEQFSLVYQVSCVAAGEEIKTPREVKNKKETSSLEKKLKEKGDDEQRIDILKNHAMSLSEEDRENLRNFYGKSLQALRKNGKVTETENYLINHNYLFAGLRYVDAHKLACYLTENPIRTPKEELEEMGIRKTKKEKARTEEMGKRIGKMYFNRTRSRFGSTNRKKVSS